MNISGYWILDTGYSILDTGYSMSLDFRCSMLDEEQKNLNTRNCIADTLHRVSSIQYRVSIFDKPVACDHNL